MQHANRPALPTSKSPALDVTKPSALKSKAAGLGFADAEKSLKPKDGPMPVTKPAGPMPLRMLVPPAIERAKDEEAELEHEEAEKVSQAITGATKAFEKEKGDSGEETYMQRHERHQENKATKEGLKHLPKTQREERYKDLKKHSPDTERRMKNAELKDKLKGEAKASGNDFDENAYQAQRTYAGGADKDKKAKGKLSARLAKKDAETKRKTHNAALKTKLKERKAGGEKLDVDKEYKAQKQPSQEKIDEKAAAAQTLSLTEKLTQYTDDDVKAKADRLGAAEKAKSDAKKAEKAAEKAEMKRLEQEAEAGKITWEQAAASMSLSGISDEKHRQQWNAKIRGNVSKDLYRKSKIHRGESGHELEKGKVVKNITTHGDKVVTTAGTGALGGNMGGKASGNTAVGGERHTADNGQTFSTGGQAAQAGGVIGGVSAILGAANATDKVMRGLDMRKSDDDAERMEGKTLIQDGAIKLTTSTTSGTNAILRSIQAFTADPAVAAAMQLEAVPIVGIIGASVRLVDACATLASAAYRLKSQKELRTDAKQKGQSDLAAALKGTRNADIQLVTSSTVDIVSALTATLGHGLTLGGVTGPAGMALVGLSAGISAMKLLGETVYESVEAHAAKKAQVKYTKAKAEGASDKEIAERGKHLITSNIHYAIQIITTAARGGDPIALKYLGLFDLDTKNFEAMSDENIRSCILNTLAKNDDPETMLDTLKGVPGQLRGGYNKFQKKTGLRDY